MILTNFNIMNLIKIANNNSPEWNYQQKQNFSNYLKIMKKK